MSLLTTCWPDSGGSRRSKLRVYVLIVVLIVSVVSIWDIQGLLP